jgi:hypothetical protein
MDYKSKFAADFSKLTEINRYRYTAAQLWPEDISLRKSRFLRDS